MTADVRSDTMADDAQGTSGRTGKSLGELTENRGDPNSRRLDLSEDTTAPLQDPDLDGSSASGGDGGPRVGSATSPQAVDEIGEIAAGADFGEGTGAI